MGFKRSEARMKQIEVQLREGMARKGIAGEPAERIIRSITSFALYGFPESHAASFALLAYASAYLKVHYPAAFYTSLLNNQPMGFYHPATLVKDAQRRGVRFHPIDVQQSDWRCRVDPDGAIRLGLMYVNGLRTEIGQAIAAFDRTKTMAPPPVCPKCGCEDGSMIEVIREGLGPQAPGPRAVSGISGLAAHGHEGPEARGQGPDTALSPEAWALGPMFSHYCNVCSHAWRVALQPVGRFASIDALVQRTGVRRDELATLADIGALNAFARERRSALWQVERAVRPGGQLFEENFEENAVKAHIPHPKAQRPTPEVQIPNLESPLPPMGDSERLQADYAGMGLTIGPHPMALRRGELALRGVLRAADLPHARDGRRVRVAGMVITRQRPGTAKGFVFLTLEDETGISNVIVRPDLFDRERMTVVRQPFLIVDGVLQHQDGVLSVRAERVEGIAGGASVDAHDFY
jgi:error-prone DNA polymerase